MSKHFLTFLKDSPHATRDDFNMNLEICTPITLTKRMYMFVASTPIHDTEVKEK